MKIKILGILIVTLFMTSCNDIIEEEPITFLSPESLTSEAGAIATLKGAYDGLQDNKYYQRELLAQLIVKADYVNGRGSYLPAGAYNLDANNISRVESSWGALYSAIGRVNEIISGFVDIPIDEEAKNQYIAEAKVLRAFHYFHLVRCWGDVPLRLQPVTSFDEMNIAKSSQSDVYNQIVADLTEAINSGSLAITQPSSEVGRITVDAAKAILSDVYLTLERYSEASSTALEVINTNRYSLESDLYQLYSPEDNATHSGEIWSIKYLREEGGGMYINNFIHNGKTKYSANGWRVFLGNLNNTILRDWDDNDLRKTLNLYDTDPNTIEGQCLTSGEPMLFKKYIDKDFVSADGHGNDMPLYRYADILTIFAEAECMAKGNPTPAAYDALNQVRRRAYGVDVSTPDATVDYANLSKDDFIQAVWNERAYEFMMEGKRWYDMKRMGKTKVTQMLNDAGVAQYWGEEDWYWPIPRQEIDNNEMISETDQNPGY